MKFLHSCLILALLAIITNTQAKTQCKLAVNKAQIRVDNDHIRIRGDMTVGNKNCKPTSSSNHNDVSTTIRIKAKKNYSLKDAKGKRHSGNDCTITASWYNKPDSYGSGGNTQIYVPTRYIKSISCAGSVSASKKTTKKTTTKKKGSSSGSSSSSSGAKEHYSGQATFFTPNQGACGDWNDNNDLIAALSGSLYGSYSKESSYCGKKVKVVNKANGKSVTVTVKDACESCDKTHIDLSPAAFGKIGDYDTGILKVDWYVY